MKYKHALCLYPYYKYGKGNIFPPCGIEYVATALEGEVRKVTLIDLRIEQEFHKLSRLNQFIRQQIDLLCVSVDVSFNFPLVCNLIKLLPPDIPLVVGGRQATDHVEELFRFCPNIDIIVRGEGEETIREIAQDKHVNDILGISYKDNGRIVHNPNRPLPPVDMLRIPDRGLRRTPYHVFYSKGNKFLDVTLDTVLTARGCPYNCKFCNFATNPLGQKRHYSVRSPEAVVEEIRSLDADGVFLADDNFCVDPERTERICDLLIEQRVHKKFVAFVRIEISQYPKLLKKMEQAGIQTLIIGIESPHDRILHQLNKGFSSQNVRDAFSIFRQYNFFFLCTFIYGNLGESREEMLCIAQFAKEIGADYIFSQNLQARKHSHIKELVEQMPEYHLDPEGFVYSDMYSKDELKQIYRTIHKNFFTFRQNCRIAWKLYRLGWFSLADISNLPPYIRKITAKKIRARLYGRRKGIPYE